MVPIRETDPLGAIGNYWAHRHKPTAQEIALLQALATSTAVAMEAIRIREDLARTGLEVIDRLALAAEYRDDGTHEHTARVARTSRLLAQAMGPPADEVSLIAHVEREAATAEIRRLRGRQFDPVVSSTALRAGRAQCVGHDRDRIPLRPRGAGSGSAPARGRRRVR